MPTSYNGLTQLDATHNPNPNGNGFAYLKHDGQSVLAHLATYLMNKVDQVTCVRIKMSVEPIQLIVVLNQSVTRCVKVLLFAGILQTGTQLFDIAFVNARTIFKRNVKHTHYWPPIASWRGTFALAL